MSKFSKLFKLGAAGRIAVYLMALWKLFKHPETPKAAKWAAIAVLAYAVSPIDLIPDFIPVLGLLDELVLIPLGIALVTRLTPAHLWQARLREAEETKDKLPRMFWGAIAIGIIWALLFGLFVWWLYGLVSAA